MWKLLMGAVVATLVVGVGGAGAGHEPGAVKSYTGCLSGGAVFNVREGDTPMLPCVLSPTIHLGGGDITAVRVGTGLTGGSENGVATIGLGAGFGLPQGCSNGQVPKWNGATWGCGADNDTTYSAGADLDLVGTTFSVKPGSFARANRSCAAGQFANGVNASGEPTCGAPSSVQAFQASSAGGNQPDENVLTTHLSLPLPAGTYVLIGKGNVSDTLNGDRSFANSVKCGLRQSGALIDEVSVTVQNTKNDGRDVPFALTAIAATGGESFHIACRIFGSDVDGVAISFLRLVAIKIA